MKECIYHKINENNENNENNEIINRCLYRPPNFEQP
jgi:hypothetical protein